MIFYACDVPEDLYYDIERDVWIRRGMSQCWE
jgi:hypothetical protein